MLVPLEKPLEPRHVTLAANFRSIKVTARILHVGTGKQFLHIWHRPCACFGQRDGRVIK